MYSFSHNHNIGVNAHKHLPLPQKNRQAHRKKRRAYLVVFGENCIQSECKLKKIQEEVSVYRPIISQKFQCPVNNFLKEIHDAGIVNYTLIEVEKEERLAYKYNIQSVPTTILIDKKGEVLHEWHGYDDDDLGQLKFVNFIKNSSYSIRPFSEFRRFERRYEKIKNQKRTFVKYSMFNNSRGKREKQFLSQLANAYQKYDASIIEDYLDDDMHYSSMWVFQEITTKQKYMDYLAGKLKTMKNNDTKIEFELVKGNVHEYALQVSNQQTIEGSIGFVVDFNNEGKVVMLNITAQSFF